MNLIARLRGASRDDRKPLPASFWTYVVGQTISNGGTAMDLVALSWVVLSPAYLHKGPAAFAAVAAAEFLPFVLVSPLVSRLVTRFPPRRLLLACELGEAVTAALLAVAAAAGVISYGVVVGYAVLIGLLQSIEVPARQLVLMAIVPDDFQRGYAYFSTASRCMSITAPLLAGVLIRFADVSVVFAINAGSFLFVFALLLRVKILSPEKKPEADRARPDTRWWIPLVGLTFLVGAIGYQFPVTNLLFSVHRFDFGSVGFGAFGSAVAAGSVVGSLIASRVSARRGTFAVAALTFGVAEAIAGIVSTAAVFVLLLAVIGAAVGIYTVSAVAFINREADTPERGRVLVYYNAALIGCVPVGTLIVGLIFASLGLSATLALPGLVICGAALAILAQQRFSENGREDRVAEVSKA